jgi:hypothetical protein
MKPESVVSGGACHRDHRGRDASLVRLPDSDCTSCHGDLAAHMKGGKSPHENSVTSFTGKHPDFRQLKEKDPGNIKFNHALHMTPGQVSGSDQAGKWTLDKVRKVDSTAYERYKAAEWQKEKGDDAAVVLDCASCHVFDAGDSGGKSPNRAPDRLSGAYAVPVNYETNCQACHPLSFDPAVTTTVKDASGNEHTVPTQIPHHLQPPAVDDFLWGAYADAYLKKNPALEKEIAAALKNRPSRPLPGKAAEAAKTVQQQVDESKAFLFKDRLSEKQGYVYLGKTSCGECHSYDDPLKPKQVLPSNIPDVWQKHARFNHVSHRAMDCRSCHANAYATLADGKPNDKASTVHTDVLLPDIKNCQTCHSPPRHEGGKQIGGVRHDCTGCHSYHNGANPLQGLGAAARNPKMPLNNEDFLRGGKK